MVDFYIRATLAFNELRWALEENFFLSLINQAPEVFFEKGVLKDFAIFTGKHRVRVLIETQA